MKLNLSKRDRKKFCYVPHNFFKSYTYYRRIIDVTSYIKIYKEFELYKKIVMKNNKNDDITNENKSYSGKNGNIYNMGNYLY